MTDDERPSDADSTISAIDQLPLILAVCEGPDLQLVWFNEATRALLPGRDAVGRPMREVLSDLSGQQRAGRCR